MEETNPSTSEFPIQANRRICSNCRVLNSVRSSLAETGCMPINRAQTGHDRYRSTFKDLYEVLAVEFNAWEITLAELLCKLTLQNYSPLRSRFECAPWPELICCFTFDAAECLRDSTFTSVAANCRHVCQRHISNVF